MPESLTPEPATYFSRAVVPELSHGLAPQLSAAETARQNFVKGLRSLVVNGLTEDMHHAFQHARWSCLQTKPRPFAQQRR